jgi:hypothetical protein
MADLAPIETLQKLIAAQLPGARVNLDAPHTATGSWFLDFEWNGAIAIVEWRPSQGFGISGEDVGYGEGPEIVTPDIEAAAAAAIGYLKAHGDSRDALIVTDEQSLQVDLQRALYEIDLSGDVANADDAAERLRAHLYRSVIVDMRLGPPPQLVEQLRIAARSDNVLVIAIFAHSGSAEGAAEWAQVLVQRSVEPRELGFMLRSFLGYVDKPREWPRIHAFAPEHSQ